MEDNKKSGGGDVRASKSPSEMAYRGQLQAALGIFDCRRSVPLRSILSLQTFGAKKIPDITIGDCLTN